MDDDNNKDGCMGVIQRIKDGCKKKGLSMAQFLSMVGKSSKYLYSMKFNGVYPSVEVLLQATNILGLPLEWLILGRNVDGISDPEILTAAKRLQAMPDNERFVILSALNAALDASLNPRKPMGNNVNVTTTGVKDDLSWVNE